MHDATPVRDRHVPLGRARHTSVIPQMGAGELLGCIPRTTDSGVRGPSASTLARIGVWLAIPLCDAATLSGAARLMGLTTTTAAAWLVIAWAALNWSEVAPHDRITLRLADDVLRILARLAVVILVLLATAGMRGGGDAQVLAAVGLVLAGRCLAYSVIRAVRRRRWGARNTLIVGAGAVGEEIASAVTAHPELGLRVVGFLGGDDAPGPHPTLGSHRDLEAVVGAHRVHHVVVAFGEVPETHLIDLLHDCAHLPVAIHVVPRFFELNAVPSGPMADELWGIPLVRLPRHPSRRATWPVKRAVDVVTAGLGLVALSPLLLVIAAAIRLGGAGSVLFRQRRVTGGGRTFDVIKFRTLAENRDSDTTWSVAADRRVTRVGRLLRRTGLDEVPQLINVLRGDMTLVGPRPERPLFVDRFSAAHPRYAARHRVPSGLTGWAQIHGLRGDTSISERVRFDNHYIEHWSLWRDLTILLRTLPVMLRAQGR
jgi:exopolysaccharide biosynthesis polyprenyl glycosylphosphotransferase